MHRGRRPKTNASSLTGSSEGQPAPGATGPSASRPPAQIWAQGTGARLRSVGPVAATARLRIYHGDGTPHEVPLQASPFVIGRGRGCNFVLKDPAVSRGHLVFELVAGYWTVTDDVTENGTFVNGALLVGAHRISHGDQLRLGDSYIRFDWPLGKSPAEPSPPNERDDETVKSTSEGEATSRPRRRARFNDEETAVAPEPDEVTQPDPAGMQQILDSFDELEQPEISASNASDPAEPKPLPPPPQILLEPDPDPLPPPRPGVAPDSGWLPPLKVSSNGTLPPPPEVAAHGTLPPPPPEVSLRKAPQQPPVAKPPPLPPVTDGAANATQQHRAPSPALAPLFVRQLSERSAATTAATSEDKPAASSATEPAPRRRRRIALSLLAALGITAAAVPLLIRSDLSGPTPAAPAQPKAISPSPAAASEATTAEQPDPEKNEIAEPATSPVDPVAGATVAEGNEKAARRSGTARDAKRTSEARMRKLVAAAKSAYTQGDFIRAREHLEGAIDTAPSAAKARELEEKVVLLGKLDNLVEVAARSEESNPLVSVRALEKALRADAKIGGAQQRVIRRNLVDVAVPAALHFMAAGQRASAREAAEAAARHGARREVASVLKALDR